MAVDLSKYIKSIKIETAFLPTIDIDDPFKPGVAPNPFLRALKPKITVNTSIGEQTISPYGEPGPSMWPVIRTALLLATVAFLARKILSR